MTVNQIRNPFIRKSFLVFWAPFVVLIILAIGIGKGLFHGAWQGTVVALEDWVDTCNFVTGDLLRMIRHAWHGRA